MLLSIFITKCHLSFIRYATLNIQRDGLFEIMKYFLLCVVQLQVGDVGEAGGVQREVRQDDSDGRVAAKSHLQFTKFTIYVVFSVSAANSQEISIFLNKFRFGHNKYILA